MKWQKKLTKKELKHIKETTSDGTLRAIKTNRLGQTENNITCHDCDIIARKLGLK